MKTGTVINVGKHVQMVHANICYLVIYEQGLNCKLIS